MRFNAASSILSESETWLVRVKRAPQERKLPLAYERRMGISASATTLAP
jgi:hypothetical protein